MTDNIIKSLDFPTRFIAKIGTELAKPEMKWINKSQRKLTEDEQSLLNRFLFEDAIHEFMFNHTTQFNETVDRIHLPPIGYTATFHQSTPFDPNMFYNLFMGFSMVFVEKKITVDYHNWKAAINALVPDKSPLPPSLKAKMAVTDAWYPSLGRQGWIAIGESVDWSTLKTRYAIYLVSSLDESTYDEMERVMYGFKEQGLTVQQAFVHLKWYREVAEENRKRILYLLVTHLEGLSCQAVVEHSPPAHTRDPSKVTPKVKEWLGQCGVKNLNSIWSFYTPPTVTPCHCPLLVDFYGQPEPEEEEPEEEIILDYQPKGIRPDVSVTLDDVVESPGDPTHRIRISNHCLLKDKVVRIQSPVAPVMVFEVNKKDLNASQWLYSYPAIAPEVPRDERTNEEIMTMYNTNPILLSETSKHPVLPHFLSLDTELAKECITTTNGIPLQPKIVRLSKDHMFFDFLDN